MQLVVLLSVETKPMPSNSPRSCPAFMARGAESPKGANRIVRIEGHFGESPLRRTRRSSSISKVSHFPNAVDALECACDLATILTRRNTVPSWSEFRYHL